MFASRAVSQMAVCPICRWNEFVLRRFSKNEWLVLLEATVSKVGRMLNKSSTLRNVLLTACAAAAFLSTGCRSMPGSSLFGMRSEPSAEALAGSGPTTTYPAPPSASATPQSIESIAGGTAAPRTSPVNSPSSATAQVAGIDISPGYATPATNMAAAQANGIYRGAASSDFQTPKTTTKGPSGYTFGSKALTPKTAALTAPKTSEMTPPTPGTVPSLPSNAKNSAFAPPASSYTSAPAGFTPPPSTDYASATNSTPPAKTSNGFTFPTDSPAAASITLPSNSQPESNTATTNAGATAPATAFAPPVATAPEFSTASTASALTAPSTSATDTPDSSPGSGYTPGSTSGSSGYPTGEVTPTTQGSFFR